MNVFDIIALAIFALFVILCAIKGLSKIIAKWAAFFVTMILAKPLGGALGEMLLGDILGGFAPVVGTIVTFLLLLMICGIIFKLLAKIITKALHAGTLDHILGAVVGIIGGVAAVFVFAFACDIIVAVVSIFNESADLIASIESATILKYFIH